MNHEFLKIVEINNVLFRLSKIDSVGGYCFARNIKRLEPLAKEYNDIIDIINNELGDKNEDGSFKRDEKTGAVMYGEKEADAKKRIEELNKEERSFEPYTINKSEFKDEKIPGVLLLPLLDIIIIEDEK